MKKIEAKIIADSINKQGNRITTYLLTFPRFILAELNTHRMFSKNSASSRAIPFEKMVKMVEEDPFIPIAWQKSHVGMQGSEYWGDDEWVEIEKGVSKAHVKNCSIGNWIQARNNAVSIAKQLYDKGITKQLCNRLLEPFMWHTVLVTATEFDNFFELRCPKYIFGKATNNPKVWKSKKDAIKNFPNWETHNDLFWRTMNESQAEIHIQALAEAMWDARNESTPKTLQSGEWHIPFGDNIMMSILDQQDIAIKFPSIDSVEDLKIRIATARCARLSYMTFDGEIDYEKDIALHDHLLESHHMSPFEHCAIAMSPEQHEVSYKNGYSSSKGGTDYGWCNNFRGWIQYRYLVENIKV